MVIARAVSGLIKFEGKNHQRVCGKDVGQRGPTAGIDISDPRHGEGVVNLKPFPIDYHVGESWTHTYLTKAPNQMREDLPCQFFEPR